MRKCCLLAAILFTVQVFSQTDQGYHPEKINRKSLQMYSSALARLRDGMVKESIPYLKKSIEYDTNYVDAYLSLAGVFAELKDYKQSVDYYQKSYLKDTVYFSVSFLPYSISLAGAGRFKEALEAVERFLKIPELNNKSILSARYRERCYKYALAFELIHSHDHYVFSPVNLGDSVNSAQSEYYPSMSIDDSLLVFTRYSRDFSEDFMECYVTKDGFTKAKLINGDINLEPRKGALTLSADGAWMLFAGDFGDKGNGGFDIYISYYTDVGWSEPENLGPNVNTQSWESAPSLSPDNRALYFSSNRPGGYGGKDLYMSIRQNNGKWGPAINMGPSINTTGDEQAPYIHADNQTLYYTSDGLPGYGGTDLFIVRKDKDGIWGVPENLGYPINTIDNEGSMSVSANGLTAFYASDRSDSRGGLDLYKFDIRNDIRPHKTLYVKGRVYDVNNNRGLPCAVELINNKSNQPLMHLQTDELGKYFIPLPAGDEYTFAVNRKNYLYFSEVYDLTGKKTDSTYVKDIPLQPITVNASMILKNIQFDTKSYELLPISLVELDKLFQVMNENPSLKVEIRGYTDNVGKAEDNMLLSENRAKSVVGYLITKGVQKNRLSYKGYGAERPIADNKTELGRAKNRRTEVIVLSY